MVEEQLDDPHGALVDEQVEEVVQQVAGRDVQLKKIFLLLFQVSLLLRETFLTKS